MGFSVRIKTEAMNAQQWRNLMWANKYAYVICPRPLPPRFEALLQWGYIEPANHPRDKMRPDQITLKITDLGREALKALLEE